jgi:hypothetical protein
MIEIRFTLTEPEYLEAQQLFMRNHNQKYRWSRSTVWALFIAGVALAACTAQRPLTFNTIPIYVWVLFVLCFYPLWIIPLQRSGLKKRFVIEKRNLTDAHVQLDDNGYHVEVPNIGSGTAQWGGISKWVEGKVVIILLSGLLMRIIPKHPLSGPQLNELRQLLGKYIGPVGINR